MTVQDELERFGEDAAYFHEHRQELLAGHPDRWVAVYEGHVVGAATSSKELVRQLSRKGIPPGQAYFGYVAEQEEELILPTRSW